MKTVQNPVRVRIMASVIIMSGNRISETRCLIFLIRSQINPNEVNMKHVYFSVLWTYLLIRSTKSHFVDSVFYKLSYMCVAINNICWTLCAELTYTPKSKTYVVKWNTILISAKTAHSEAFYFLFSVSGFLHLYCKTISRCRMWAHSWIKNLPSLHLWINELGDVRIA
jgi:hypothetical protein